MSSRTSIEWVLGEDGRRGASWNPADGCTHPGSPGCDNCYAARQAERFRGTPGHYYEHGFAVQLRPAKLDLPLQWRQPLRIFVNSMGDLFHSEIPSDYIAQVWAVMAAAGHHTFMVLTKRHNRMRKLLNSTQFEQMVRRHAELRGVEVGCWPLRNVWVGVSAETQAMADRRIAVLLDCLAWVRMVSVEPLLSPLDIRRSVARYAARCGVSEHAAGRLLHWVIVGGESGPVRRMHAGWPHVGPDVPEIGPRPMHPDWVRSVRDQCQDMQWRFLFKQWGAWVPVPGTQVVDSDLFVLPHGGSIPAAEVGAARVAGAVPMRRVGKHKAGCVLDGRLWHEFPDDAPVSEEVS